MKFFTGIFFIFISIFSVHAENEQTGIFWKRWGDGKAEVNVYDLQTPRYAELRKGKAVLIYVTEDIGMKDQVKTDKTSEKKMPVLKLNHVRSFQTGVYDYRMMLSVFSPVNRWSDGKKRLRAVTPIKTSLVSTEWCGNYYDQINTRDGFYHYQRHSYFEGEADQMLKIDQYPQGIFEDDLLIRVRELIDPFPEGSYRLLSSTLFGRYEHDPVEWRSASVERREFNERYQLGDEQLHYIEYVINFDARRYTIQVEHRGKNRILGWEILMKGSVPEQKETARLLKTKRLPYWKHNALKDEALLKELGLK